jgi:cyclic pyranopterin phosphate synthase
VSEKLHDAHGRAITDLRVSVTDRCNFRCQYCMPADGLPWLDREEILSFEEIERLVRLLVSMGISDVRLSGGEPLVRRDSLPQVLRGLEAIGSFPQVHPVKVNAIAMRDFTEQEVLGFCDFAKRTDYVVRFIEFMPLDADRAWTPDSVLTGAEIRELIEVVHPLEEVPREPHATARVYRFADGSGEIGFINPVSEPFCADCNRIRLTAEGELRTCLFSVHETDLKGPMRAGADDAELEAIVRDAVWRKELKHHVNEPGFRPPPRTMSAIGG